DPKVDTIFEIGGQDAKYTYITNSVPSDYAMNEACSAGTGSFLEESAHETLGIKMEDIADVALMAENPPNFNDQCAAFITSDIKNAIHEGVEHKDIVAGLVYSICMNYSNRVKGNRPVGEKVFMQGGVCYNSAVPLAMASLVGKPIVVPPEPGLMGSFGVALEVKKRIDLKLTKESSFDLNVLANREVEYGKTFTCRGGKGKCDRRCRIAMIILDGRKYPFGGACNRYYNMRNEIKFDVEALDLVRIRQQLVFDKYAGRVARDAKKRGRIGFNRSYLVNTYFPLYSTFFAELGFESILPDSPSKEGIDQRNAAFCYPGELSHGFFHTLLNIEDPLDYIFLPHFKAVPTQSDNTSSQVCPLVQGETFYLRAAFKRELDELGKKGTRLLAPLLNLTKGIESAQAPLVESALKMGISRKEAKEAFKKALLRQEKCMAEFKEIGRRVLSDLEANPEKTAVVMFGRPYNAFVEEAHMGIPHKLASRGILTIPLDFLPFDNERSKRHMYWGMGQLILKAARFVEKHPQLFGTFITNFSCGPDSFIVGYFRSIMGRKPSLTLELDNHTADAGLETRIEAFLDIVAAYRQLVADDRMAKKESTFISARTILKDGNVRVITSSGEEMSMTDSRVTFITPSMGRIGTDALGAVFRGLGLHGGAHSPADEAILKLGRANTSCKECLPLILTTGTLLNYVYNVKKEDEILVYFMPTGAGPCRFGQYYIFMEDLIRRLELPDVTMLSLTSENSYAGLGNKFHKLAWCAIVIGDAIEDIRSVLLANAVDVPEAMRVFESEWKLVLAELEKGDVKKIEKQVAVIAERFSRIPMKRPIDEVPVISVVGEIFVRRDGISRQYITERLAEQGFAVICSPVSEWIHYSDFLVDKGLIDYTMSTMEKLEFMFKKKIMVQYEKRFKSILSRSGLLVHSKPVDLKTIIANGSSFFSPHLTGEAILTVGSAMSEVVSHSCGVIAI
ncbi:MAG: activase, partial [Desulfobulbaceae bacterium]|nr:activase [Desulfobulbaceae bacterium]